MRTVLTSARNITWGVLLTTCFLTIGCQSGNQVSGLKVLIGATAVIAPGSDPIEDSVIVISGETIRAAGMRKDVPIPQDSERTNLAGKWIVPVLNGHIAVGEPADLLVLDAAPSGQGPRLGAASRRMVRGQWQ